MHRRAVLKSAGLAAGAVSMGGLLAACGEEQAEPESASQSRAESSTGEEQTLTVISASFETLVGTSRRYAFGVASAGNVPLHDADLRVRVRDMDGTEVAGPFPAEFVDSGGPLGIYLTRIDVPEAGRFLLEVTDGEQVGEVAINVVAPEDSQVPVPGQEAIATATPTVDDDMGVEELCTRQPDCGMHAVSLDEALDAGRPIMLVFATPAYCQTAVCGPVVDTLEEVRTGDDWGDVAFIHVEIFADAGRTVSAPVQAWDLPTEPWLFAIGADGAIVDRIDGIMVAEELAELASTLA